MGSSSERSSAPESQLISRRTLVRAGAIAAWAVPAIQVVGAAPALAVSNSLLVSVTTAIAGGTKVRVTGTVKNPSATVTLGTVTLVFTLPTSPSSSSPSGGDFAGSGTTYTVTSLSPGASKAFDVTFVVSATPSGSVTASATAQNASPGSGSLPISAQTLTLVSSSGGAPTASWAAGNKRLTCDVAVSNPGPASATSAKVVITVDRAASSVTFPGNGNSSGGWTIESSSSDMQTFTFKWTGTATASTTTSGLGARINFDSATPQPKVTSFSLASVTLA